MWRSWKLGTAFGIGIHVHWTFFLLPAFILLSNWGTGGLPMAVFLLLLITAIFGCVVLHELGHALMARHFGIGTRDITLYPIGGVARLERMPERPWQEVCIALAGPAVNVALIGILLVPTLLLGLSLGLGGEPAPSPEEMSPLSPFTLLASLLLANGMLAGFNLIPAFPMDGGRVLRALLALGLGQLRATEIAAGVGMVLAALIGALALIPFGDPTQIHPQFLLLAGFVFVMGRIELAGVRYREARRRARALEAIPVVEEVVDDALPVVEEAPFSGYVWDVRTRRWAWRDGRRVGTFGAWSE